jgi:hypothetical protein
VQELALTDAAPSTSLVRRAAYVLRVHVWLLSFVAAYFGAAIVAAEVTGRTLLFPWGYLQRLLFVLGILVPWCLACYTIYAVWKHRPARPLAFVARELSGRFFTLERVGGAVLAVSLLIVHSTAFSFFKCLIPAIQPYTWDAPLASWDKTLHLGVHPWEHLQAIAGFPPVTLAIDFCYVLWAVVIPCGIMWFAVGPCGSRLRMQVLLTNVLAWFVLGNVVATLLSSAGPCYYRHLASGEDPFGPLKQYLTTIDQAYGTYVLGIQDWLWEGFTVRKTTLGYGISAMPSMHVGTAFLLALATWRRARWLSYTALVYTGIILVGSVHLAWHYAIDGYVALAGVAAIWWGVGRLLAREGVFDTERGMS